MFKIGVLASGKGSNLQAIMDYIKNENLPAEVSVVISDNDNAFALKRAEKENIKNVYIPPGKKKTYLEPEIEKKYVKVLQDEEVNLVCLAGFMRVLKPLFLENFAGRIINIHPSLLPAFPGLEAWKQAINYGVKFSGCTVHFVNMGVDKGPIIVQAVVPVLQEDTPESLHKRIQEKEHIIYPFAIKLIVQGKIKLSSGKVNIK
jgi:phosphoribosylglycinamide formyltransferase 1